MTTPDDHHWNLSERDEGYLPKCEQAYRRKLKEWEARDWPDWLTKHLAFPFTVTREESDLAAHYSPRMLNAPFRLGNTMEVLGLAQEDLERGAMLRVSAKGLIGYVPLSDVAAVVKTDANFWPVREYVIWFANRY